MTTGIYQIDLPAFNGPLDLLLHLIEREELDITAISLQQVTGQYLAQVEVFKTENRIDNLIDFLVIAARLVLIKSRALLPQSPALPGDELDEEDPAETLLRQLRLYKKFKESAAWLNERQKMGLRTYYRVAPPPRLEAHLDLTGVTSEMLVQALKAALNRSERMGHSVSLVKPRTITIEKQIARLRYRIKTTRVVPFTELLSSKTSRLELAVTLLAVLELVKRHEVNVTQSGLFGPIEISASQNAPPPA